MQLLILQRLNMLRAAQKSLTLRACSRVPISKCRPVTDVTLCRWETVWRHTIRYTCVTIFNQPSLFIHKNALTAEPHWRIGNHNESVIAMDFAFAGVSMQRTWAKAPWVSKLMVFPIFFAHTSIYLVQNLKYRNIFSIFFLFVLLWRSKGGKSCTSWKRCHDARAVSGVYSTRLRVLQVYMRWWRNHR